MKVDIDILYRDKVDRNRRRIPLCEWKKALRDKNIQERIRTGSFYITLGYPLEKSIEATLTVKSENIIGKVLSIDEDNYTAKIELYDSKLDMIPDINELGLSFSYLYTAKQISQKDKYYVLAKINKMCHPMLTFKKTNCYA